jgi:hypothetical protein
MFTPAGFGSEQVAGFGLECMAGFVGIRSMCDFYNKVYFFRIGHSEGPISMSLDDNSGAYMKQHIRKQHIRAPMALFLTLSLAMLLAVLVPVQASRAADDCLPEPNVIAPDGSHWYYRIDRTTHRECWYLGPVGRKVGQHAGQDASSVPPPKMTAQPAPREAGPSIAAAEAGPAQAVPVEITRSQVERPEDNPTATPSARWSDIPMPTPPVDPSSDSIQE